MNARLVAFACLVVGFAGCATPTIYEWGDYQESVYALTAAQEQVDINAHIDSLNATVERARAEGKPVPPGMHAHIGMLYSMRGEFDTAAAAFETEKELYPESAVFVDGVLQRMREAK